MSFRTILTAETVEQLRDVYRHLHANPELSMQEHETARFIESKLQTLGVETFRCAGTGVVAVQQNGDGPVVAFRADTDALPIHEETGLAYASTVTGTLPDGSVVPVMHGCGHDAHTAVALTAVEFFAKHPERWSGTIVWIFQPGEETAEGSKAMVDDGLWNRAPKPEVVFGQHISTFSASKVKLASGHATSMADSWEITLHGVQAHASRPHTGIDPIVLGAHIILRIQSMVARELDAQESAVVTVGTFHAGLKENIIPSTAVFTVNVRAVDQQVRTTVLEKLRLIIEGEAAISGAPKPTIREMYTFPRLFNDAEETEKLYRAFEAEFGAQLEQGELSMGSEDFGYLADSIGVPCVFWRFGSLSEELAERHARGEKVPSNHSAHFAPDLESLETGTRAVLSALISKVGINV